MNFVKSIKFLVVFLLIFSFVGCSSTIRFTSELNKSFNSRNEKVQINSPSKINNPFGEEQIGTKYYGVASFYGDEFNGRPTSDGDIYDRNKFTAAHREFPFGTKLKVTNLKNSKFVYVIVNDRGPFVNGRMIDLSYAAAQAIDMIQDGVAEVEIEIVNN